MKVNATTRIVLAAATIAALAAIPIAAWCVRSKKNAPRTSGPTPSRISSSNFSTSSVRMSAGAVLTATVLWPKGSTSNPFAVNSSAIS